MPRQSTGLALGQPLIGRIGRVGGITLLACRRCLRSVRAAWQAPGPAGERPRRGAHRRPRGKVGNRRDRVSTVRCDSATVSLGRESGRRAVKTAAQAGFLEVWHCPVLVLSLRCGIGCGRSGSGSCAAVPGRRRSGGGLDAAGLSWTSWDMIPKMRCADQAHSEVTDATRTGRGFHGVTNGVPAGQRPFRWVGMGSLYNRRLSLRWFEPSTCHQLNPKSGPVREIIRDAESARSWSPRVSLGSSLVITGQHSPELRPDRPRRIRHPGPLPCRAPI